MKYKLPGISKNKKIREQRKKILPLRLMKNETNGAGIYDGVDRKNKVNSKDISSAINEGMGH